MTKQADKDQQHTATDSAYERELATERHYVAALYDRLDQLRAQTQEKLQTVRKTQAQGTHQNRSERDAYASHYEDRLAQLHSVDHRLVFGRLDVADHSRRYIGRIGLADRDHQRLLIDWRAPEASAFYQATAFDRQGVSRRRHLLLEGRQVTGFEDDILDASLLDQQDPLHGQGALLAALERKRTGRMEDIVASIQAEQDKIIRADLAGVQVVQGGPGTGKTAVALHRAAYLLYTYRQRLNNAGVLVVGPSASFMWYIERVLPSLGETGVVLASLATLFPGIQAVAESDPRLAQLKGQLRMADAIKRAVADRQKELDEVKILSVNGTDLELTPQLVRYARDKARATGKAHNEARATFVKIILRELGQQLADKLDHSAGRQVDRPHIEADLRESLDVRRALNLAWMPLSAQTLIRSLFSKEHYLNSAFADFSPAERRLLYRPASAPFTEADVPLLDEAAELLGDFEKVTGAAAAARSQAEHRANMDNARQALENVHYELADRGVEGLVTAEQLAFFNETGAQRLSAAQAAQVDRTWAYGHIVVDEAQELSAMQWRLLFRRCPMKSLTIVGDIGQGSAAAASSWAQALQPFVGDRFTLNTLTVNYRTPAQIADAALALARAAGQEVSAARAVRQGDWPPLVSRVAEADLLERLITIVQQELATVTAGLIGIITVEKRYTSVVQALSQAYHKNLGTLESVAEKQILVLTPWEAKGLEFDTAIIVEPAELLAAQGGSVADLYVSMTRPTQRLHLLGAQPFPAGLPQS